MHPHINASMHPHADGFIRTITHAMHVQARTCPPPLHACTGLSLTRKYIFSLFFLLHADLCPHVMHLQAKVSTSPICIHTLHPPPSISKSCFLFCCLYLSMSARNTSARMHTRTRPPHSGKYFPFFTSFSFTLIHVGTQLCQRMHRHQHIRPPLCMPTTRTPHTNPPHTCARVHPTQVRDARMHINTSVHLPLHANHMHATLEPLHGRMPTICAFHTMCPAFRVVTS